MNMHERNGMDLV